MFKITDTLYVGTSDDEKEVVLRNKVGKVTHRAVDSVLVVAYDMVHTFDWEDGVEYMQVGLVDGPGNSLAIYHAAVLAMLALLRKGSVLVCDHDGGRSLAISIMYMYMLGDGPSWDEALERLSSRFTELPEPHEVHRKVFFLMDWGMMRRVLDSEV